MRYVPCWKIIGISKNRYRELLYYCRQYPDWKVEADSLLGVRAVKMDGMPHGTGKSDPVANAAERRDKLITKISVVDECAKAVGGGVWYDALIQNICLGKAYEKIDAAILPTSYRHAFYEKRREFFELLDKRNI